MATSAVGPLVRRGASRSSDAEVAVAELYEAIYHPSAKLYVFYCSARYDLAALETAFASHFGAAPLVGCTTAGEITPVGYLDGAITGVSIGGDGFEAASARIDLSHFEFAHGDRAAQEVLGKLGGAPLSGDNGFGFLLVDGMSMQEEALVASIYRNLGGIQLFGGSAGDGTKFSTTYVYHEGKFRSACAVFTLVRTGFPFVVFKTEHFVPSTEKMVVTGADPARRLVTEINGEPAGREYARVVGLDVDELSPMTFATHPVVIKIGGTVCVRSIQKVNDDESLTFFCAIDEGIVLTVGKSVDLVQNLEDTFRAVHEKVGEPSVILGCDCILRALEARRAGSRERIGALMAENRVVGFATYGEQFNGMHVNQTFTGVAIGSRRETVSGEP